MHDVVSPRDYEEPITDIYSICPIELEIKPIIDKDKIFRDVMMREGVIVEEPKEPVPVLPLPLMKGGSGITSESEQQHSE